MAEALPDNPDLDFSDEESLSSLEKSFNEASNHVRKITSKLNNNQLLELYGLYKQSTEGKCNTSKPSWLDGKGRKKWDAWKVHNDMRSEEAMKKYVELVQKLDPDSCIKSQGGPKESWAAVSSLRYSPEPELVPSKLTIFDAARENMGELAAELLSKNPELKCMKDDDGLTALHWAADRDATHALNALIKGGCDINAVDNFDQTPLHYAATCDHANATQILVDAGADLLKDDEDCTPLDLATHDEVRRILESASK
ncbi:jg9631 [Pararge aegeria aegeria]|uniref:Acyl-CoA-binding domain-containing protein 6 n=2 Tax=Pararge aegeria TaxID=116150 RepID=A0A8S4RUQ3_9NEOP|nr:jg9631 [Pararge aegeria aegeria]